MPRADGVRNADRLDAEHVQTKREIVDLLRAAGVSPSRRLGQHFLIDGNLMRRLAACAELGPQDLVLEVGGGTGGLTDLLAERAGHVLCVEADRRLHALLEERFQGNARIALVNGDILETKHRISSGVAESIRACGAEDARCVKLVANLPYQVATPVIMNLLIDYPEVRRLCFTVQAEVGERMTAGPNRKAYGPLSIIAQVLCSVRMVARVPSQAFWPQPAVDSVMIRMDRADAADELTNGAGDAVGARSALRRFAALLQGVFEHRRKTLRSALTYAIGEEQRSRLCQHIDTSRRPESLSVEEWVDIFRMTESPRFSIEE